MAKKPPTKTDKQSPFVTHVLDMLRNLGTVEARRMFGGYGVYVDGLMSGLIADDALYLKVDSQTQPEFEAAGCRPFEFHRKDRDEPIQMSYWEAPADAMERAELLCAWMESASAAAKRAKRK